MRDDGQAEILGQLREVYDGSFTKEFGTGKSITWEGRIGFIAGTTQSIDAHHAVISILGERFLYFRVPEPDRRTVARTAIRTARGDAMRADLRNAMAEFVGSLLDDYAMVPDVNDPEYEDVREQLVSLSDVVTWARTAVYRDRFSRDIEIAPTPEGPARFAKQLVAFWQALETMEHPDSAGMIRRVALDSMPPARAAVLQGLGATEILDTNKLRDLTQLSTSASKRVLEDMEALGILERVSRGGGGLPATWTLDPGARTAWLLGGFPIAEPHKRGVGGERENNSRGVFVGFSGDESLDGQRFASLISHES